jgi:hypothetical protein
MLCPEDRRIPAQPCSADHVGRIPGLISPPDNDQVKLLSEGLDRVALLRKSRTQQQSTTEGTIMVTIDTDKIEALTAALVDLGEQYSMVRIMESGAMENTREARKELRKFERRAIACKTFTGQNNNRAKAEYQRCVIRDGEARILALREDYKHLASEIARFKEMISETEKGLSRRNANCDGPCTDATPCTACEGCGYLACDCAPIADGQYSAHGLTDYLMDYEDADAY